MTAKLKPQTFLHARCKVGMCDDCIGIAEEYQTIESDRKVAMYLIEQRLKEVESTFNELKRKAAMWEDIANATLPDIIDAWIKKEIEMLLSPKPKALVSDNGKPVVDRTFEDSPLDPTIIVTLPNGDPIRFFETGLPDEVYIKRAEYLAAQQEVVSDDR